MLGLKGFHARDVTFASSSTKGSRHRRALTLLGPWVALAVHVNNVDDLVLGNENVARLLYKRQQS